MVNIPRLIMVRQVITGSGKGLAAGFGKHVETAGLPWRTRRRVSECQATMAGLLKATIQAGRFSVSPVYRGYTWKHRQTDPAHIYSLTRRQPYRRAYRYSEWWMLTAVQLHLFGVTYVQFIRRSGVFVQCNTTEVLLMGCDLWSVILRLPFPVETFAKGNPTKSVEVNL